jgi:phosphatidylglycerol:prolipoprotein diacylglycerol transferase
VRRLGVSAGAVADAVGLTLPLSLAIARVGCFLNGCCGGKPSGLPWAVTFPGSDTAVHPTQLYELVLDLAVFCFLLWARRRLRRGWDLFLLSVACYGAVRFAVEFFRYHADASAGIFFRVVSALLFCAGVSVVFFRERRKTEKASEPGGAGEGEDVGGD